MNFYQVINAAIADIEQHGFDSQQRIDGWLERIEVSAKAAMLPESSIQNALSNSLGQIYRKAVDKGGILKMHPGLSRFKLDQIKPHLRNELDRRIMASAQLVKMNRLQSMTKTLQRFSGWATSIPAGGSKAVEKPEVRDDLKKALKSLPYEERRVAIDQGHKLISAINDVLAVDGGAIALEWKSHFRQPGYDYRVDHKERDGRIYTLRNNWAQEKGLMKVGDNGYYDEITSVGEEVFCRCQARYIYSISQLPSDMRTKKGQNSLNESKIRNE